MTQPQWLDWAQRLQALAQNGLTYTTNPFDAERYRSIQEIAAEILSTYTEADLTVVRELLQGECGYATPKLDARGVVFHQGKILLVKELADGGWTLPGGWIDINEPPSQAVEREVFEESGYRVRCSKLLAVYDRNLHGHPPHPFHIYKLFFRCELNGGSAADSIETSGANFYALDEVPPLSIARTSPDELQRMFAHDQHPEWPTDFD